MKLLKNRFLFIILISVITLVVLVVGALSLYKDNSSVFASDGYILETTTKTNKKYYFSANTKYKENVDEQITFSDKESNKVVVDPASFVHYSNGNVSFLQKGALVNLNELTAPMVSYYNITSENTIVYEKEGYTVTSNGKKINIESFVGRINDQKYIIAGKDLFLKIPKSDEMIAGDYFEILFIEEGIVKIDNQEVSHQVTAQGTYIYVGDDITISLGDGKILYDGVAKMLLSQITINGDENIDLDVVDQNGTGGGSGSDAAGGGAGGEGEGADGEGTGEGDSEEGIGGGAEGGTGQGVGDGTGEGGEGTGEGDSEEGIGGGAEGGTGQGVGDGTGEGGEGTGTGGDGTDNTTASPQIELIEVVVTTTSIDLAMQLNNANLANGNVVAYLTNVATGKKETPQTIPLTNGTFNLSYAALIPNTEYALTIVEVDVENEKQYFQKTFKTKELGVTLEKVYATQDSLSYRINFDDNSEVSRAHITIYENNGTNTNISPNEFTVSKDDIDNTIVFTGLKSNMSYSISVDKVWIKSTIYSDLYPINRIDTTLKKKPTISGVKVDANSEEVKFDIKLQEVKDSDNSIVSYIYNIYLADDITLENLEPEVVYSVTKNDADALVLNLNEIDELKTGVDYRCKIMALYNDNEMIREVSTDYSNNFLIKSKPNITFDLKEATMNKITGTINLVDANCTVPMNGRSCFNKKNTFTLRYYKLSEEETTENDTQITFNSSKLTSEITLSDLSSNTTYAVKLFGDYYDDDNVLHSGVQIGDTFYVTTDKSDNLHFEIVGDNVSGKNKDGTDNSANVVTFDARLTAPQNSTAQEEISSITLNLYSGRYNSKEKLIGTYTMTERSDIDDFFSNLTIVNSLFTDVTSKKVGKIDSLNKMLSVTNVLSSSTDEKGMKLNSAYTVEVTNVMDSTGQNEFTVENNVYTFNLTPSYFLDSRIQINSKDTYVTVTKITKKNLTEEEYATLSKTVKNLDDLNDDTVVGIIIENSLSDILVDSAFTYEKVTVNYTIYNSTTGNMIKTIPIDMGNKYQPKAQTVYLDSSELGDGINYFTRGYTYKIGFNLDFVTEDGSNPNYTNDVLYKSLKLERQSPIYEQYIKTSDSKSITYRCRFKDVDLALYDKNIYYTLGKDTNYSSIQNAIVLDEEYHDVVVPISNNSDYTIYYGRRNASNNLEYVTITSYRFEKEYQYSDEISYKIVNDNDNDNILKLRLENNDFTNRAAAYKVVIKARDKSSVSDYTRYFLASKLSTLEVSTGEVDENGKEIMTSYSYIGIDYANISRFMGHQMVISVYAYYDNGLVGLEQTFDNGLILEDSLNKKYLNIYNGGSSTTSYSRLDTDIMGIYFVKEVYNKELSTISLYNKMMYTDINASKESERYNPLLGASYYDTTSLASNIGIQYGISFTNIGMTLTADSKEYSSINMRVLKEADLKTDNNVYQFDTIIPTIQVTTGSNTINSINVQITPFGIYGDNHFVKDGKENNKVYLEFYSDENCEEQLDVLEADITITGDDESGYSASIKEVEYSNLKPATKYYFKVFAYIDGKYTRLYDSSSTTSYVTKTYSSSTLDVKDILSTIQFKVVPKKYSGEFPEKELTWRLDVKSTENYKIRLELYDPEDNAINFDGSTATSCDINALGVSSNAYVTNCYITVGKDNVSAIDNKSQTYSFTNSDFVFGDGYYKLVVYAIPYTNGEYVEDQKLTLYQEDALTNGDIVNTGGIHKIVSISALEEPTVSLNDFSAGYLTNAGYYVSFSPSVVDKHKVIKYGKYTIVLKDEKGNIVGKNATGEQCTYYINKSNDPTEKKSDNCVIEMDVDSANQSIQFTGLTSNTLYYAELSYEVYRNNVGFTEEQKVMVTPFTDFIYTPIAAGITLGTVTATQSSAKSIILNYNGSANLIDNITRVEYTISLKGGSSKTTGTYSGTEIFTVSSDRTPKLTIDASDIDHSSNTSFTFRYGNTYIITTQYYYKNSSGEEQLLEDQETGKNSFTTILNL